EVRFARVTIVDIAIGNETIRTFKIPTVRNRGEVTGVSTASGNFAMDVGTGRTAIFNDPVTLRQFLVREGRAFVRDSKGREHEVALD
ncbi:MAG: hypothetical protein V4760_04455, partial [Bdellovibrionota bacterium]